MTVSLFNVLLFVVLSSVLTGFQRVTGWIDRNKMKNQLKKCNSFCFFFCFFFWGSSGKMYDLASTAHPIKVCLFHSASILPVSLSKPAHRHIECGILIIFLCSGTPQQFLYFFF